MQIKGSYLNNELGKKFLVGDLIQVLKNKKAVQKVEERTSRDQLLFIHSTNIYSALSPSQELFEAKKIHQ